MIDLPDDWAKADWVADFYELLGVHRGASQDELKRAYRRRARELHPDANPDDPHAAEQFKELARAYEVLSDPEARARYDRFGEAGLGGPGGGGGDPFSGGGLGDIFEAFFGGGSPFGQRGPSGPPRGADVETVVDITLEQAVFGDQVRVEVRTALRCEDCHGSGAGEGTQPVTCSECNGRGQVQRTRQSLLGQMVTSSVCPRCNGLGQIIVTPCPTCNGEGRRVDNKTFQVEVPAGVDTGSTLRLTGRGAVGPRGGAAGDLYVHIRVAPHDVFSREGDDLLARVPVSVAQAALGTTFTLPTLDGDEELVIPAGTQPGHQITFRNRGAHRLQGRGRGNLVVEVVVEVPTELSAEEDELLRRLAEIRGETVGSSGGGLFKRIKSAFQ